MGLDSNVEKIDAREGVSTAITDGYEDLTGDGTEASLSTGLGDPSSATLYVATEGAVELTVEFSPDGGTNWFEPNDPELPLKFDSAGDDVVLMDFNASDVRVTASDATGVKLALRVTA
ncbi:hypothetical protein [Haloparvum sedimenti]|uniref:hypothetical protein n=1 Tax=Haloparvum sedimenti TaxID=1678448 RepID=UPI00071E99C1|nr:hypothetical protein [Haloparvum sedimenti]